MLDHIGRLRKQEPGSHAIVAYSGDASFIGSLSPALTEVVSAPAGGGGGSGDESR